MGAWPSGVNASPPGGPIDGAVEPDPARRGPRRRRADRPGRDRREPGAGRDDADGSPAGPRDEPSGGPPAGQRRRQAQAPVHDASSSISGPARWRRGPTGSRSGPRRCRSASGSTTRRAGTPDDRRRPPIVKYAGDGHDHWHVQRVAGYELYADTGAGPALRRGAKVGFCFFDTRIYRASLARSPAPRRYLERGCGTKKTHSIKIGLSVGWADVYPWNFAWQWVNVTGLPAGTYLLKLSADPDADFLETREANNCNWTRIRIPKTGSRVTVIGRGQGCQLPGDPPPPSPSPSPARRRARARRRRPARRRRGSRRADVFVTASSVEAGAGPHAAGSSATLGDDPAASFSCSIPTDASAFAPGGAGPPG